LAGLPIKRSSSRGSPGQDAAALAGNRGDPPIADPPSPEPNAGADGGPTAGSPRWVKVSGVIAIVALLLVLIVLLKSAN
jgi:hypothetical protein